ncbi:MAG: hypothetical protein HC935_05585 [Pseudanabaena sp. SU_2_4]|nr:hypothetical protein [Pseudanabaena sp. SU_2_4]
MRSRRESQILQNAQKPLPISTDRFLVCGWAVWAILRCQPQKFAYRDFAVSITAIDNFIPESWEIDDIMQLLAEPLIVDDCRKEAVLERAGVRQCRAILLVTSDESTNIETAIAARPTQSQHSPGGALLPPQSLSVAQAPTGGYGRTRSSRFTSRILCSSRIG